MAGGPLGLLGGGSKASGLLPSLLTRNKPGTPETRAADIRNGLRGRGARILDVDKAPGQVF